MPGLEQSTKSVEQLLASLGDTLRYLVRLANASPFTVTRASLYDPIPTHTTYISGSVSGGATYNAALRRIEWQGGIPPATAPNPPFSWVDASSGRAILLEDDSCAGPFDLGFAFEFYGQNYTQIHINSNGLILFDDCSTAYGNTALPDPSLPNNLIAPFWDDLNPAVAGRVYMATFGVAPERYAVVAWVGVPSYGQANQLQTFEVMLYESTNLIICQYLDVTGARGSGSEATVGLENASGTQGYQYLHNGVPAEHALRDHLLIELPQPSTRKAATQVIAYDVRVDDHAPLGAVITNTAWISDGWKTYTPSAHTALRAPSFASSTMTAQPARVVSGETVTFTVTITNSGNAVATAARVVNALPVGVQYVAGTLSGHGATIAGRTVQWEGGLIPGASATISYRVRVDDGLAARTTIVNTGLLSEQGMALGQVEARLMVNDLLHIPLLLKRYPN
jgi:uncharacterized repeat protein (TIGR01451 family)